MKIVKGKAAFEPVVLTLETQEEVDIFTEVFYHVGGQKVQDVFGEVGYVYRLLEKAGGTTTDTFNTYGSIHIN